MRQSEHTPTPWRISNGRDVVHGDGTNVTAVAEIHAPVPGGNELLHANAAFIVRACNSHDALVAALRAFMEVADDTTKCHYVTDAWISPSDADGRSWAHHGYAIDRRAFLDVVAAARAALKLAEEG